MLSLGYKQKNSKIALKLYTGNIFSVIIYLEGGVIMESMYVKASEVAEMTGVSKAKAYKMVAEMNEELKAQNYLVISGRVPRKYLMEKLYQ